MIVGVLVLFAAAATLMLIGDDSLCVLELAVILTAMTVSAAAFGAFVFGRNLFVELAVVAAVAVVLVASVVVAAASVDAVAILPSKVVVADGAIACRPDRRGLNLLSLSRSKRLFSARIVDASVLRRGWCKVTSGHVIGKLR